MYTFTLERTLLHQTDGLRDQVHRLMGMGLRAGRGKGWEYRIADLKRLSGVRPNGKVMYTYRFVVALNKTSGHKTKEVLDRQFKLIRRRVAQAGGSTAFGKRPWNIVGYQREVTSKKELKKDEGTKPFGKIDLSNVTEEIPGIYGREAHIQRILSSVKLAWDTDMVKRYHCILHGPPGCGKTELLKKLCDQMGPEQQAYLLIDATCTTQAGIVNKIMDSPVIPPIMVIEEIEKADESALRWLLSALDTQGRMRKLNARTGYQYKDVAFLVLATANDLNLFKKVMSGALVSRFSNRIHCPRPSKQEMERILTREVISINGNLSWVLPTIDFCMGEMGWNDPREIIPVCLCGRDQLLDGSYQEIIRKTSQDAQGE